MNRRQPYRPLWADPPPDPQPRLDVVVHRVVEEDDEIVAPARSARPRPWAAIAALILVAATLAVVRDRDALIIETVPSGWEDIVMRCDTLRLQSAEGAVEAFHCRAVGGGVLPPGVYSSPDARWTSDITLRDARASLITISPEGELRGRAIY